MSNKIKYIIVLFVVFAAGIGIGNNLAATKTLQTFGGQNGLPEAVNEKLINEVWNNVKKKYVGEIKDENLAVGMLRGLVSGVGDPYSAYATREETNQFEEEISGQFSGIGVEIGRRNGLVTVIAPLKGSPAEAAGIKAQDIIVKVDSSELEQDMSLTEVADKIRGPEGTEVKIGLIRENEQGTIEVTVLRKKIELESVTMRMQDGIGIIELSVFHEDTARKFRSIAKQLLSQKARGIVLDLRNNPGGLLTSAVQITGHFVNEGNIAVKEVPADEKRTVLHKTRGPADLVKIPIVVLVNGGSASASEILAGALRDLRGVKIIGEKTFGKGSVQELVDLSDGSSLRITIAKWLTPKGSVIAEKGIEPDVESIDENDDDDIDTQLDQAITILKTELNK